MGAEAKPLAQGFRQLFSLTEAVRLAGWGFENYGWRTLLSSNAPVARVPVTFGDGTENVELRPERDVKLLLSNSIPTGDIESSIRLYDPEPDGSLMAPIIAGDAVGEITLTQDGREIARVKLVTASTIRMKQISYLKNQFKRALGAGWGLFLVITIGVLLVLYAAFVIRHSVLRQRRKREIASMKRKIIEDRRNGDYYNERKD
jgi:hypothetical protein